MKDSYDDIINLPHHTSQTRPRMSLMNRAAQFAPFAALTGYGDAINETARSTNVKIELDESAIETLDQKLSILAASICRHPEVFVVYFHPDKKKDGGSYITAIGSVKKIDYYRKTLVLMDGKIIKFEDILNLDCQLFKDL